MEEALWATSSEECSDIKVTKQPIDPPTRRLGHIYDFPHGDRSKDHSVMFRTTRFRSLIDLEAETFPALPSYVPYSEAVVESIAKTQDATEHYTNSGRRILPLRSK